MAAAAWPELPYAAWRETRDALHLWTQVVGKVRLAQAPWVNHSWHVPLYVTARGLTTSLIPHGTRGLEIAFDFVDQVLDIAATDGARRRLPLAPGSVAAFHDAVLGALAGLGVPVRITPLPCEIPGAIPFPQDTAARPYDGAAARRFWQALVQIDRVLTQFRSGFTGKCSPVHFFWGSFDIAVTRFSGRKAPPHPGGVPGVHDAIMREAYSDEVSSAGFWPGGGGIEEATFYSYTYPEPAGFRTAPVRPDAARFDATLGEFVLPYDAVRTASDPDAALLAFLQSTYEAAARAATWDPALDGPTGRPGVPRPV